jgi:hypothetical protein
VSGREMMWKITVIRQNKQEVFKIHCLFIIKVLDIFEKSGYTVGIIDGDTHFLYGFDRVRSLTKIFLEKEGHGSYFDDTPKIAFKVFMRRLVEMRVISEKFLIQIKRPSVI